MVLFITNEPIVDEHWVRFRPTGSPTLDNSGQIQIYSNNITLRLWDSDKWGENFHYS